MDSQHLRAIILKVQYVLSDDDRQRLHFFLGNDVPRRFRDDPSLRGTLNLMDSLFDQDKISEDDFTFLINAFDETHCTDAVKILRGHMRKMQTHGQHQSMQSLTSILLHDQQKDEEDKCPSRKFNPINLNPPKIHENNNITTNHVVSKPSPILVNIGEHSSVSYQSDSFELSTKKMQLLVLFALILIIVLATTTYVCVVKIRKLNNMLTTNNKSFDERIQTLVIQLDSCQLKRKKCFSSIITRNDTKWKQNGITIAGGNGIGNQSNQFNFSFGIHVDDDGQNVYITDFNNNRVIQGKFAATNVEVVVGGNRDGYQLLAPTHAIADQKNDSLIICDAGNRRVMRWFRQNGTNPQILLANIDCYGLAMDKKGHLYVSDYIKNEVRRWEETVEGGMIVAGGNEQGNNYTQLDRPGYIFVNHNYSVYVSDRNNHRVMKWMQDAKEGSVVAGGHGEGHNLTQLASPQGLTVDKLGNIYVADLRNHRVMRWVVNAEEGRVIAGGNGEGQQANQLLYPTGMSWDFEGNLYVADCSNNRVQRFDIDVD